MKVLACTSVVLVLLAANVQARRGRGAMMEAILGLIESCQGIETQCRENFRRCSKENKPDPIDTEEALETLKTNLEACASEVNASGADFSTLTLETVRSSRGPPRIRFQDYGVEESLADDMMLCLVENSGKLPALEACLTGSE